MVHPRIRELEEPSRLSFVPCDTLAGALALVMWSTINAPVIALPLQEWGLGDASSRPKSVGLAMLKTCGQT
jgi:NCAIR mutase (PurE)-related protein